MKIVILHRIPYSKARYGSVIDHTVHDVTYVCRQGGGTDLPLEFNKRVLDADSFDAQKLGTELGDLLSSCDRLIARSEYDLIPAATLRDRFGIAGDGLDGIRPMRDKLMMRRRCAQAGVTQPQFWAAEEFLTAAAPSPRYLLKPRLEASSYGIQTGGPKDIEALVHQLITPQDYLVEAFVDGSILHVDGFAVQGDLQAAVTSAYVGNCLAYASGSPLGSVQTPLDKEALDLSRNVLRALGHFNGSFHLEIIVDGQGRYHFLEVASRVGGAGVAETFELKTGLNLYQADLLQQLFDRHVELQPPHSTDFYGWFVYPGLDPRTTRYPIFNAQKWLPGLISWTANEQPKAVHGAISYAPDASPLSGVLRGDSAEVKGLIERIFRETPTSERLS
jgi:hypothetical protein